MVWVTKASGERELFSEKKIKNSLKRSGVDKKVAQKILRKLKEKLYEGISTQEIHNLVSRWLVEERFYLSSRYQLKRALAQLGPSGYPFEKFFAGVLQHLGWQAKVGRVLKGYCTTHEIDVIAQKKAQKILIECKFHSRGGTKTDVKTALYLWARFEDLKKLHNFAQVWLVTNTKLTSQAIAYCECVGIKPISWNYKEEWSLRELVEKSGLHPITTLTTLSQGEKQRLLAQGIVFCHQLLSRLDWMSPNKKTRVAEEIAFVCQKRCRRYKVW